MHRKCKSGIYSNNSIRYNRIENKNTKNITYENGSKKINCNQIYNISVSKKMNYL
jgi:hypothetical protein